MDDSGLREKVASELDCLHLYRSEWGVPWSEIREQAVTRILAMFDAEYRPGWISVKERLPDDARSVLIFGERCEVIIAKWYGDEAVGWYSDYGEKVDVTYWRPLPEPPKE